MQELVAATDAVCISDSTDKKCVWMAADSAGMMEMRPWNKGDEAHINGLGANAHKNETWIIQSNRLGMQIYIPCLLIAMWCDIALKAFITF